MNHLPEVKKFVMEQHQAHAFSNLQITFIPGRMPELILYDASDKEVERINLETYTYDALHKLMLEKNIVRGGQQPAEL